jgi:shikimate kinase
MGDDEEHERRIVVVGPCAAGKSTLVNSLGLRGYGVRFCLQEHSFVPRLWQVFSRAEILIYLDAELPTIARRQNRTDWTEADLSEQRRRLAHARTHCDLYLPTDELTREQVADAVEAYLRGRGVKPSGGTSGERLS